MTLSERWLQDQVRKLCADLGLAVQHIERSDLAKAWLPGWPDLWIAGPNGILYRELKANGEAATADQRKVGRIIIAAGGDWDLWWPSQLYNGRIASELTAISTHGKTDEQHRLRRTQRRDETKA